MIAAQQLVDQVLAEAARLGGADETTVIVTDRADASLRWAGNSMTTNGETRGRSTTVISVVRRGEQAHVGSVSTTEVDRDALAALVAASQAAAASAPAASDNAPALPGGPAPADWDAPVPSTGADVFADVATSLVRGFRGEDRLYG
ncbi:MAG: peptidase, partial [Mycobacterium sp.]|nr:peptidase [Mycobacterium sp.]